MATSPRVSGPSARVVAAMLLGAVVGGLVGALAYEWVAPVLERRTDALRDAQGMLWNLVPLLAVVGAYVAGRIVHRRG